MQFYEIDSTRFTHREYWWGTKSPVVLIGWLLKWLRIRMPGSTDDPNVDSTLPFQVEALPPEIETRFEKLTVQLAELGFLDPVYHQILDSGTRTAIYWATYRHASGRHFARIHHRIWQQATHSTSGLFPMFFTAFQDGTFLVSSSGKPDTETPVPVQMNRMYRAGTLKLFQAHERIAATETTRKLISEIRTRQEMIAASERHHVLVRDFHLDRGTFRPRTDAEQAEAEVFAASVEKAEADGVEHGDVLAEVSRLQEDKPGWGSSSWILLGTIALFLGFGAARWDWKFTLLIIPVLFFHEAGHWIAMRLFRYRNVRMFFIPLFGAAVIGRHWNVAGWKKALVSLAGPLPGIALGVAAGTVGLMLGNSLLIYTALILLLVNAFNLLPFLPLDGGHVLQATLFCRNRWLDIAFRVVGIAGLVLMGLYLEGAKILMYLGIFFAIGLPLAFKLGKVTDEVRKLPLPLPLPSEDRIPVPTAQAIITALKGGLPHGVGNKVLAQHTINIFETLNARPPGALATFSLLALHGGALFFAFIFGVFMFLGQHGDIGAFLRAAVHQARYEVKCGEVEVRQAQEVHEGASRNLLVATFKRPAEAANAFADLTARVPAAGQVALVDHSILLGLPAEDDAAREYWFDELESSAARTFVAAEDSPIIMGLSFIAPSETAAVALEGDLEIYFAASSLAHLIPPWAPEAGTADFQGYRHARSIWLAMEREMARVWEDPALAEYPSRIAAAHHRGAIAEARRLDEERDALVTSLEESAREKLRAAATGPGEAELFELHAELAGLDYADQEERAVVLRRLGAILGGIPLEGRDPVQGTASYAAGYGFVGRSGLAIQMPWVSFNDAIVGVPALIAWLCGLGCEQIRYEFHGPGFGMLGSDD